MMNSILKYMLLAVTVLLCALPLEAVLPEDNIDRTVIMLSADMKVLAENIKSDMQRLENRQREFRNTLNQLSETCDKSGVVLYSQDERYLYGTLQATQTMKDIVNRIKHQQRILNLLETDLNTISNRYGDLSQFLEEIKSRSFSPKGREALEISQNIADSLRINLQQQISLLNTDKLSYHALLERAEKLETYNDKALASLQTRIFHIGNESIGELFRHFPDRWHEFTYDLEWRFLSGQSNTDDWNSREDKFYDLLDINEYIAIFMALCFYIITQFKRFCPRWAKGKRIVYSLVVGLVSIEIGFIIIRLFAEASHQFYIILMIESELYLLALMVFASSTIRLNRRRIARSLISYLPIFFLTFALLEYREDLVAFSTVTFSAPFLFLFALVGQIFVVITGIKKLDVSDRQMAWANLLVIAGSLIVICVGYTVLATMVFLLWIGILNGLMILALVKSFIAKRHPTHDGILGITTRLLIYPLAIPAIILMAFIWVAHVYNLTLWFSDVLATPFLDMPDKVGVLSIAKLLLIYGLGVCVNYVISLVKMLLHRNEKYRQGQVAVWISVGNILVWMVYIVAVLVILEINRAGVIAAIGGASVGIGLALKDTFANLFSGMSLIAGRLRPGDIVEFNGERGKVLNIGIISTSMETEDGPILTVHNSQLFEKNFKNMTRNHCVELRHITFDISTDNDPKIVRELILNCFRDIDGVDNSRRHVVIMRNFGSGVMRVELKVWIDSDKYLAAEPAVREAIFEIFRDNGISKATFIEQIDAKGADSVMTNNRTIL